MWNNLYNLFKVDFVSKFTIYTLEVLPDGCSNSLVTKLVHLPLWSRTHAPNVRILRVILKQIHEEVRNLEANLNDYGSLFLRLFSWDWVTCNTAAVTVAISNSSGNIVWCLQLFVSTLDKVDAKRGLIMHWFRIRIHQSRLCARTEQDERVRWRPLKWRFRDCSRALPPRSVAQVVIRQLNINRQLYGPKKTINWRAGAFYELVWSLL